MIWPPAGRKPQARATASRMLLTVAGAMNVLFAHAFSAAPLTTFSRAPILQAPSTGWSSYGSFTLASLRIKGARPHERSASRSGLLNVECKGKAPKVSKKRATRAPPLTPASADMSRHISVNLAYPGLKLVHKDPPVFTIQNFFDPATCEKFRALGPEGEESESSLRVGSATFGGGFTAANRQSTTWFLKYEAATELLKNVLELLPDLNLQQCEEPQIVRYEMGDFFNWHEDKVPDNLLDNGGQRIATLLVYLNDVADSGGGATAFKELDLKVQPEKGKALLFFPAFLDGQPDDRTLHAGSPAFDTKWIAQMWIHQSGYRPAVPPGNSHQAAADVLGVALA